MKQEEERHGRKPEYDVFKTDPVKLERLARLKRKQRLNAPVEEAPAQLPDYPIVDPGARYLEYNKPKRIGFFPTVARNYTFWADLIFKPGSRSSGMVLFVEGTSRWCKVYPFKSKVLGHSKDCGAVHR